MFGIFNILSDKKADIVQALNNKAYLVDVRTREEFAEGSAQGAVNIPVDEIPKKLSAFEGKQEIIVFCKSGGRSAQAKRFLTQKGFEKVTNGGTWKKVQELLNEKS